MLNKEQIEQIFEIFAESITNPKSELIYKNNFTFCVAVILSAQSTDKGVNKITPALFAVAPTPHEMLNLGIDGLKEHIKTIGLFNNKAKNIIAFSNAIKDNFNNEIPQTREQLEALPGIGRKTANVILNELFGFAYIAVDTHVLRVSNRLGLSRGKTPKTVEVDLELNLPKKYHKNASNYLVLHGRYVCKAQKPECKTCNLRHICEFPQS